MQAAQLCPASCAEGGQTHCHDGTPETGHHVRRQTEKGKLAAFTKTARIPAATCSNRCRLENGLERAEPKQTDQRAASIPTLWRASHPSHRVAARQCKRNTCMERRLRASAGKKKKKSSSRTAVHVTCHTSQPLHLLFATLQQPV